MKQNLTLMPIDNQLRAILEDAHTIEFLVEHRRWAHWQKYAHEQERWLVAAPN